VGPAQKWSVILRDISIWATGIFGLLHQELTGQVNPWLLGTYTTILGVPGAASLVAVLKDTGGGGSSPSAPPQAASVSDSSL
jgi:hypothetical protein